MRGEAQIGNRGGAVEICLGINSLTDENFESPSVIFAFVRKRIYIVYFSQYLNACYVHGSRRQSPTLGGIEG